MKTAGSGIARSRKFAAAFFLIAGSLVFAGCNNNKSEVDALLTENQELRESRDQIQRALNESEQARAALEAERDGLLAENDQLRGGGSRTGSTGFEGVAGAEVLVQGGEIVVSVAGDVLFDSGSVNLKADAKKTLDQIAGVIQSQYSSNDIRIAGHTDSDPIRKSSWKTNERLSAERALAVEDYLGSKGVNKGRMYIAGYGPDKPRGSKKDSRRVEIVIVGRSS